MGDVFIILGIYAIFALIHYDWLWFKKISLIDILALVVLGLIIAVGIEKYALVTNRWGYNPAMPILSYVHVGLFPVLQMAIVPFLTFFLVNKYLGYNTIKQ